LNSSTPPDKLQTRRAQLTLLDTSDFGEILDLFQEPDTFQFIPHLQNKTPEEYRSVLANRINQIASGLALHFTARTSDGELIGVLNYSPITDTTRMQLGFQIRIKFHGQGYATELAQGVIQHLRNSKKEGLVYGVCSLDHTASATVLQRVGFQLDERRDDVLVFVMDLADHHYSANSGKSS
jgi:ribosomal-protein-alanine N-acetyltransferase